ncbi:glutathione S-transferase N-terminal domain-containing protein [Mameliella sediminis]|uniref:glutathione S-transferase N-terminal domain-containing protein n=1 Tax=Mameliella sediminis TaxID=2836866 RepID=UPI001C44D7FE|nr:glutathione S-transferase N-terminal domain-containing protein [Mameliella sediminis]MBY6113932.1 glutathione S-transferase N-terminal domain-containing protein [Antarctobacter heliothermus]MBY6142720.1 glutathione S-transferase N-terminal domain-containing protein [Mameliella alba]MBV7395229.1 glutathione S-transferase N-terminal domain-containing protein [Mameliella sediminis]MBY6159575.1 glutathione S-transferase N-terminal domain-containing protein [Mameliella alba]MBY6168046.1 glutathi
MIDAYFWPTPNGWKISIALEEMGLDYRVVPVNILRGDQFSPDYLKISPNNRMPAIVDHAPADGGAPISVFEGAAILIYLAEKTGQFLPANLRGRTEVLEWLAWQAAGVGPMFGQAGHFKFYAPEPNPYGLERYTTEVLRLYGVLDRRLEGRDYICGDCSIADFATWPWVVTYKKQEIDLGQFANVRRWYDLMKTRPGLRRGYDVGKEFGKPQGKWDDEARKHLMPRASQETGA